MQFGFMEDFRNPQPWRRPYPELYRALLDQIVRAEELGYDNVWLTEHHFTEDGYNPSLLPTAAAVAARTSRIRIGTFVLLLPFQHPVRVAEDALNGKTFDPTSGALHYTRYDTFPDWTVGMVGTQIGDHIFWKKT